SVENRARHAESLREGDELLWWDLPNDLAGIRVDHENQGLAARLVDREAHAALGSPEQLVKVLYRGGRTSTGHRTGKRQRITAIRRGFAAPRQLGSRVTSAGRGAGDAYRRRQHDGRDRRYGIGHGSDPSRYAFC